jgi:hypothetical protein
VVLTVLNVWFLPTEIKVTLKKGGLVNPSNWYLKFLS